MATLRRQNIEEAAERRVDEVTQRSGAAVAAAQKPVSDTVVRVRWPADEVERMRAYFAADGLSLSAGIRQAVARHMRGTQR
ncbi:MAG: hypothetical protein CL878_07985 [Dehalococcoidia bacterium]|nr:hypothetical protein [Dehalococcoidia bacterium]